MPRGRRPAAPRRRGRSASALRRAAPATPPRPSRRMSSRSPPRCGAPPAACRRRRRAAFGRLRRSPSATARSISVPDAPSRSAIAHAAGTTLQPGWALDGGSKSSVSSAWPIMPLARAALAAEVTTSVVMTMDSGTPPSVRTYLSAICPRQQGAAGHDRGEAVEETVLGLTVHVRGQSAVSGLRHVVRQDAGDVAVRGCLGHCAPFAWVMLGRT